MIRRHPAASYFALAFVITWPFDTLAFLAADRAGIEIGNEDNFTILVDALATTATWDRDEQPLGLESGTVGEVEPGAASLPLSALHAT